MSKRNAEKLDAATLAERFPEEYAIISDSLRVDAEARKAISALVEFLRSQDAKAQDTETAK